MALVPSTSRATVSTADPNVYTANQTAPAWIASGLTGATAASRYVGATASGAPASGSFVVGDHIIDQTGALYICTAAGTPGTWSVATANLASGRVVLTSGDITTTNTNFEDMTGLTVSVTTGARRCLVSVAGVIANTASGRELDVDIAIDGSRQGGTKGLLDTYSTGANFNSNVSFSYLTAALTAGAHTIKLQWRTSAGTSTARASSASPFCLAVVELYAA